MKVKGVFEAEYIVRTEGQMFVAAAPVEARKLCTTLKAKCVMRIEAPMGSGLGVQKHSTSCSIKISIPHF